MSTEMTMRAAAEIADALLLGTIPKQDRMSELARLAEFLHDRDDELDDDICPHGHGYDSACGICEPSEYVDGEP